MFLIPTISILSLYLQIKECEIDKDAVCGCDENSGFFQTGKTTCEEIPTCLNGYKLKLDLHPGKRLAFQSVIWSIIMQKVWESCWIWQCHSTLIFITLSESRWWNLAGYAHFKMYIFHCWLTLTSEMHSVTFHPEGATCLLPRGKESMHPRDEVIMKIHKKFFSGIPINFTFLSYLQNYKEFEAEILRIATRKIWAFI